MREIISNVLNREAEAIRDLTTSLDSTQVEAVSEVIRNCRGKVILSGCGTSAQAARKIAHTLCCIGCPALFAVPSDALHGGLGVIGEEDVLLLLSKGGYSKEISEMILPARQTGAKVIMVTENEDGEDAKRCNLVLKIKVKEEPDRFNMLATASTLAVIAVFDAVCISLMEEKLEENRYTKETFLRIHPEGDVGKRLAEGE